MKSFFAAVPLPVILLLCVTLGLAPYTPEPHIWEKLKMLFGGTLSRPIDWFDLCLHGLPWLLLVLKLGFGLKNAPKTRD